MVKLKLKQYSLILLGIIITAFAISVFFVPNKIVNGGLSGVSTILYHKFNIPAGASFAIINAVLLAISLKFIGKDFVINSLLGVALISVFVEIFSYVPPLTDDVFLASVFGAVLYGFGIGLTLVQGASTGGTDILGRLAQCAFPNMKIGLLLLLIDSSIVAVSMLVFGNVDLVLFGVISLFLSTYSIDLLIHKLNISKLAFVISDHGCEIASTLVHTSPRGVTIIDATGAYTMQGKQVLICALKNNELLKFQHQILKIDSTAFIIFSESQQIVGNGFRIYK